MLSLGNWLKAESICSTNVTKVSTEIRDGISEQLWPWLREGSGTHSSILPGKSHGWRSLVGCGPWGCEESDMTERRHFHFSPSCTGEGGGSPLQCSCLENPRDGGAWWAAVYGVAQSRTRLKRLSSSSMVLTPRFSAHTSQNYYDQTYSGSQTLEERDDTNNEVSSQREA